MPEQSDDTFQIAVSIKMAQAWGEMWLAMVRAGVPRKAATKMMEVYLRETLGSLLGK